MASGLNYSYAISQDSERSGESGSVTCSDGEEYSDETSSSYTDDYEPAWIDKVSSSGILFYVEPLTNLNETSSECRDDNLEEKISIITEETEEKPSTTGKLKRWMEHRKKNIKKKFTRKSNKENTSPSEEKSLSSKVPSNRSNCDLKEVFLNVDLSKHNYGRRATLGEKLFGIIFSTSSCAKSDNDVLIVCDLTPEGEAYRDGTIKIGDWIKSIDGVNVSAVNFENVLNNIQSPKQVKIVVQQNTSHDTSDFPGENCICDIQSLCEWLEGSSSVERHSSKFSHVPHAAYFLSLGQESSSKDNGDVIYSFPNQDGQLFKQKGMFVTLGHMISDIATPPMLSCSLAIEHDVIHVGYAIEGQKIMVLCIPDSCANAVEVKHYTHGVVKFLKLQFSSLSRTFEETFNKEYLDQFFNAFFHSLFLPGLGEKVHIDSHFLDVMPSVHWLPLPSDLKIVIDDILSQFESADFGDDSEGYYEMQRVYSILGACLFYKSYLLGSHLNKDDLLDIHLLLKYQKLLAMSQSQAVCQAVIWREIYPTRKELKQISDQDYVETDGRYFLLAVAIRYSIIAVVLEAGGCSLKVSGHPSPEPFYVEQVENTLLSLEESGIYPALNKIIDSQDPQLANPENFLKTEKSSWELLSSIVNFNLPFPHSNRMLSRRSQSFSNLSSEGKGKPSEMQLANSFGVEVERQQLLTNMGPADGESDAEANTTNDDSPRGHNRSCSISNSSNTGSHDSDESFLFQRSTKRICSSSYDVRSSLSSQDQYEIDGEDSASWLVSGCENTLFYYLHMDPVEGVFLAPTDKMRKILHGPLGIKVLNSFFSCCIKMRTTFERSLRNRELSLRTISPKFGINSFLQAVHEQGTLFQVTISDSTNQKKIPQALNFWVIGRLFFAPEPREVYVCYQDSAEQDVVELAFRLGFGISL